MLTVNEATKLLKVSRPTLYRMCRDGRLRWYTRAGVEGRLFKKSELLAVLQPGQPN